MDVIELYQLHRPDPAVPFVDQVAGLAGLRDAGLVRRIGLSNVTADELTAALDTVGGPTAGGIVSVQNEFSPRYRADADVLDICTREGIAFLPWSPLGGATQARDIAAHQAPFGEVARAHRVSVPRVALAWLLGRSPVVVPIPGSTRPQTVVDSVAAVSVTLSADERALLDATVPQATSMYPDDQPRPPLR